MTPLSIEDVVKYIVKIKLNFENAYVTANDFERQLLAESWYEALCPYPKEICDEAVNRALKAAKFAPRLGNITEEIDKILNPNSKSDEELWVELISPLPRVYDISRYLKYSHYSAWANAKLNEVLDSFDPIIKTYLVNTDSLIDLSELTDENLSFEKNRFFKQLPNLRKRITEQKKSQLFLEQPGKTALPDSKKN